MTKRLSVTACALSAALVFGGTAPAMAATQNTQTLQNTQTTTQSGSSLAALSSKTGSTSGSFQEAASSFDEMNPIMKVISSIAAASLFFVLMGVVRTLVFNITGR